MKKELISNCNNKSNLRHYRSFGNFFAERAYSVLILAALFCTLMVKLRYALRYNLLNEYISWILPDISFLLFLEVVLALICFRWPRKWLIRTAIIIAAVVCTWSVMNAGWLIRTGTQILPRVLLPLFRSPVNAFWMIGVNLIKMPKAAVILLGPSAIALAFLFYVLARTRFPNYKRQRFLVRVMICLVIVLAAVVTGYKINRRHSPQVASAGLRFNAHLKAVMSLIIHDYTPTPNPERSIPYHDQIKVELADGNIRHNIILVVLEGVQYKCTSMAGGTNDITPYLKTISEHGVEFTNARSSLTHTTKALFTLLTGRFPSASQDLAEAVPAVKPYASLATILSDNMGYKTAFFQSAKGDFECRPGLVYNMGFQKFWSREDLDDPNSFVGYLGSDEFCMIGPISEWIHSDNRPFFLTVLCSVTHDPYEVPAWFGTPDKEPDGRYQQSIAYTDKFLAALDVEITNMRLHEKTILCIVGDHGEAFGEHGLLGHERIFFDEVLRVPFCLRAPFLIETPYKINRPVSSVDVTPTLLGLLGFDIDTAGFNGSDALTALESNRRVYFSGWMQEGPAGYIQDNLKYVYDPIHKATFVYNLDTDPSEMIRMEVSETQSQEIADDITAWRMDTIFKIEQKQSGRKNVFDDWVCRWTHRVSSAKYEPDIER